MIAIPSVAASDAHTLEGWTWPRRWWGWRPYRCGPASPRPTWVSGSRRRALNWPNGPLTDAGVPMGPSSVAQVFGLEDTISRANRIAQLVDEDAPLGRALAPDGPLDRLMRPGGLIDRLTAPDGVLDRMTAEGGGLDRALAPADSSIGCWPRTGCSSGCWPRRAWPTAYWPRTDCSSVCWPRTGSPTACWPRRHRRPPAGRRRSDRQADRPARAAGAAGRRRRHPQPADPRSGGPGAHDRDVAGSGDNPEPGGQSVEQHRRPDSAARPAALQRPATGRTGAGAQRATVPRRRRGLTG